MVLQFKCDGKHVPASFEWIVTSAIRFAGYLLATVNQAVKLLIGFFVLSQNGVAKSQNIKNLSIKHCHCLTATPFSSLSHFSLSC